MRTLFKYLLVLLFFISPACEKDDPEKNYYIVEVIGRGMDCGDTFLVRFQEEDEARVNKYLEHSNAYFPVFYANNLPEEFKYEGWGLKVTLHKCQPAELPGCTAWGPGYGHICIESVEKINAVLHD
jgi:hypothetical protein